MFRVRLRAGTAEHHFDYLPRDLQILHSKQWPEGNELLQALGIYSNFSVEKGQDSNAWSIRQGAHLLAAARAFEQVVGAQIEFLLHDYAYRMPADRTWLKQQSTDFPLGGGEGASMLAQARFSSMYAPVKMGAGHFCGGLICAEKQHLK